MRRLGADRDTLKQRSTVVTHEFPPNEMSHIYVRTDKPPFNDVRVRRAISLAFDRQALLDAVAEGVGAFNPPVPSAFKEWSFPVDQLGEGSQYYKQDLARARKLIAEAGYPNGFGRRCTTRPMGPRSSSTRCSSS